MLALTWLAVAIAVALPPATLSLRGQTKTQPPAAVPVRQPMERFNSPVGLKTARGDARTTIRILEWTVNPRTKVAQWPLPAPGLAIVLLRSGEMTTTIRGRRERRTEGANFSVPPDTPLGIETGNDAASFDLILIEAPRQR